MAGMQPTTPPENGNAVAPLSPPEKRPRLDEVHELHIDSIINKLLSMKTRDPSRQSIYLPPADVENMLTKMLEVLASQDMLLDLEAPLNLCGDIHGQFHDLLRLFDKAGLPPTANYLFLGDYVDRGKRSLETVFLLFAYKIKYKESFFLLRGNHEMPSICRIYGFYDECKDRYDVKLWKRFIDVFNWLPVCATIDEKVICMHGGLSPDMIKYENTYMQHTPVRQMVSSIPRPCTIPDSGFLCDLLWADPFHSPGFGTNDRGVSVSFGPDVVRAFLQQEDLDLVVRAHQVVEDGYEFFAERSLCTVFSAPNYCGEFDNNGAVLIVGEDLKCTLKLIKPELGSEA